MVHQCFIICATIIITTTFLKKSIFTRKLKGCGLHPVLIISEHCSISDCCFVLEASNSSCFVLLWLYLNVLCTTDIMQPFLWHSHIPTHRILHVHKYSCILAVSFFTVQNIYRKYNTNATAKTCSFLKLVTGHCQMVKNNIRFTNTIYFTVKYWVNHFFGKVWIIL